MTRHDDSAGALDRAVEPIRNHRLPADEVEEMSRRVWSRVTRRDGAAMAVEDLGPIRGCADYQALIPALLDETLSRSRRLLLESHLRECVPCRKALHAARRGAPAPAAAVEEKPSRRPAGRWALAAVLAVGIAVALYWLTGLRSLEGQAAVVEASSGEIYRVAESSTEALSDGAALEYGERIRTAAGGSALLRLDDGSLVEVRERSWLELRGDRRGTTVALERGGVLIEAAPQREGHLYVATGDCLVAVTGTIFSVNHGTKGSRVSVIEGSVSVDAGGVERRLEPGEQTVTHSSLAPIPVAEDIAWSRDVDRYIELLGEVAALRRALVEEVPRPDLRYSSRLLERVPVETSFFVALPNLAETIAEADRILRQRVAESQLLSEWLESRGGAGRFDRELAGITQRLAEFGGYLGDEVLVTARLKELGGAGRDVGRPLVLAELRDAAGLRRFVESEMVQNGHPGSVVFLEPAGAMPPEGAELYVWTSEDILLAAPELATLRQALGAADRAESFVDTAFGHRIRDAYAEGAGVLIAADLGHFGAAEAIDGPTAETLEATGLAAAEHLVVEQKWIGGRTQHRAVLGFDGARRGMAAWLAPPGPMGSLEFVSPDAKFAAAVLLVDPAVLVDDVMRWAARDGESPQVDLQEVLGVDLERDIAVSFGGEVAVAIDGPLLPEPSWKLILEVYDPDRAIWVLRQVVEAANSARAEKGLEPITLSQEQVGGRVVWSLEGPRTVALTFEGGYLVMAPNRALLDRALRYRSSGYTLASSARLRGLLPTDGRDNFSALFYQDAIGLLEPLAERIAARDLNQEQRRQLAALAAESGPSLGYAYGEPERIVFAASSTMSLLDAGLPALLGFERPFDLDGIVQSMVGSTGVTTESEG
ncbi:MAG: FecR domain-containing protein [Thermoanaerobaculia bacterium]|nr:FecR domain-containing protein [Thermoanaerobaculia bacterium]